MKLSAVRSRFTAYADDAPEPVKLVNGRQKYFLPREMDEFLDGSRGREAPRSSLQRAEAELFRIQKTLEATDQRVAKRQEELDKAVKDQRAFRSQLKLQQEKVELLRVSER